MKLEHSNKLKSTRPAGSAPKFLQAFKSLYVFNYRMLWFGMLANVAAMQMNVVARSWLAYNLSGSALILGVVALARGLPQLLLSPLGGLAADRFNKRTVLVISQTFLCVLATVNAILVQTGVIQIWHLIAIGALQGITFPFTMPTRQAIIPQLVDADHLPNALAMDSAGRNLNRVLAPSISGIIIAWNPTAAFYAVAGCYLLSALTMLRLPSTTTMVDATRSAFQQMTFGFKYMFGRRHLLVLILMGFLAVILGRPFQQMLPVFQETVLNLGPESLGFMYAAVGAGALIGSLAIAFRSDDPRRWLYQVIAGAGFGAFLIPFALSSNLIFSLAMLVMVGFFSEVFMTINRMMVLLNTDEHFFGRVMGVYAMTFSLMPIATLPMGALVDAFGAPTTIAGAGILLAIFVLVLSFVLPRIWHRDMYAPMESRPPRES